MFYCPLPTAIYWFVAACLIEACGFAHSCVWLLVRVTRAFGVR
jgi:hypothetical protein